MEVGIHMLDPILHVYVHCRNWIIRLFISGDYEFLCVIYGLSGASGRSKNVQQHIIIIHSHISQENTAAYGVSYPLMTFTFLSMSVVLVMLDLWNP